jgi:hypothetical protein
MTDKEYIPAWLDEKHIAAYPGKTLPQIIELVKKNGSYCQGVEMGGCKMGRHKTNRLCDSCSIWLCDEWFEDKKDTTCKECR